MKYLGVLLLVLVSCTSFDQRHQERRTQYVETNDVSGKLRVSILRGHVMIGMTMAEVKAAKGNPHIVRTAQVMDRPLITYWEYSLDAVRWRFQTIEFENNRVISVFQ